MSKMYYVYYDNQTRMINSISNEVNPAYEHAIIVPFEDIENFLEGRWQTNDFKIDYIVGSTELSIIANVDQKFNFNSSEFSLITETDEYAEFIVEWNAVKKCWNFMLDDVYKKTFKGIYNSQLSFFVTLESDLDFLIRVISISADELQYKPYITVPFDTEVELDISRISISSKINFKNYKLRVIHE